MIVLLRLYYSITLLIRHYVSLLVLRLLQLESSLISSLITVYLIKELLTRSFILLNPSCYDCEALE
jgi:hypothetical protein